MVVVYISVDGRGHDWWRLIWSVHFLRESASVTVKKARTMSRTPYPRTRDPRISSPLACLCAGEKQLRERRMGMVGFLCKRRNTCRSLAVLFLSSAISVTISWPWTAPGFHLSESINHWAERVKKQGNRSRPDYHVRARSHWEETTEKGCDERECWAPHVSPYPHTPISIDHRERPEQYSMICTWIGS